jgi:hypothetical protein
MKRQRCISSFWKGLLLLVSPFLFFSVVQAQQNPIVAQKQPYKEVRGIEPEKKPEKTAFAEVINGDTVPVAVLGSVYSFPKENFKSASEERYYWKLVRDVKIVYPLSRIVYFTLLETMNYIQTLPDPKDRERHLRRMEKDLVKEYEPVLRKMTYTQGKILLKLINRECNSSPYDLIKAYRGSFAASFWQGVGSLFHADLKSGYDPATKDYTLERIVIKIEQGQL